MVKLIRYTLRSYSQHGSRGPWQEMEKDPKGEWVLYEEVEKLIHSFDKRANEK